MRKNNGLLRKKWWKLSSFISNSSSSTRRRDNLSLTFKMRKKRQKTMRKEKQILMIWAWKNNRSSYITSRRRWMPRFDRLRRNICLKSTNWNQRLMPNCHQKTINSKNWNKTFNNWLTCPSISKSMKISFKSWATWKYQKILKWRSKLQDRLS